LEFASRIAGTTLDQTIATRKCELFLTSLMSYARIASPMLSQAQPTVSAPKSLEWQSMVPKAWTDQDKIRQLTTG
jgi:hypothetical protein